MNRLYRIAVVCLAAFLLAVCLFLNGSAESAFQDSSCSTFCLSETKNHELDDFMQGNIKDCWLLSTLISTRYTQAGRGTFRTLITYHKGYSTVHLFGKDYDVYDNEIEKKDYSRGDYDTNMIEIAIEHALDDYNAGRLKLPQALQFLQTYGNSVSSLNFGFEDIAMYFITGNIAEYFNIKSNPDRLEPVLDLLEQNSGYLVTASTYATTDLQDISGNSVHIYKSHSYSVVRADSCNVTIVGPEDTSKEIAISRSDFQTIFLFCVYCPLS